MLQLASFMCLPCIKFMCNVLSYILFVVLVITASLEFASAEIGRDKFSEVYSIYLENYTAYANNEELKYRFETSDFYIRRNTPTYVDIVFCIWLLGSDNNLF